MRKADLKVGDIVKVEKGKYSGKWFAIVVSLDGDAVRNAKAEIAKASGKTIPYRYREPSTKGAVVTSVLRSPGLGGYGNQDEFLMKDFTEATTGDAAHWTAPSVTRLQHITEVWDEHVAASVLQSTILRAQAVAERRDKNDENYIKLQAQVERANRAAGAEVFMAYQGSKYFTQEGRARPGEVPGVDFARGFNMAKLVGLLADIDTRIENMVINMEEASA